MGVPEAKTREELVEELHRANERLHARKVEWEKWLEATEYRHQQRIDEARERLREAEREVEELEERIKGALRSEGGREAE
jgi:hypothetical protein